MCGQYVDKSNCFLLANFNRIYMCMKGWEKSFSPQTKTTLLICPYAIYVQLYIIYK